MSTASVVGAHSTTMKPLVWLEIRRFARHPVFLVGVSLCTLILFFAMQEAIAHPTNDRMGAAVVALFIGVASVLAAYLLTRSMRHAEEILEATPTSRPTRTAALCATCGVSGLCAAAFGVFGVVSLHVWPMPAWLWGTFNEVDLVVVMAQDTLIAAIGGTLLGVTAGRWWRFRGAGFILVVGLLVWVELSSGVSAVLETGGTWPKLLRLFSPLSFFQTAIVDPTEAVDTFPGSPAWFLGWLLALCALAAVAALLHRSEGVVRAGLMRVGPVLLVIAAAFLVLSATQGPQHIVRSFPDGTTTVITSR
jgi:hypothetical protein